MDRFGLKRMNLIFSFTESYKVIKLRWLVKLEWKINYNRRDALCCVS